MTRAAQLVTLSLTLGCGADTVTPRSPSEALESRPAPDPDMPSWGYRFIKTDVEATATVDHHLVAFVPAMTWAEARPPVYPWNHRRRWPPKIEYQPGSGVLTIKEPGSAVPLPAVPGEEVTVIWLPRFVARDPCEQVPAKPALALAVPRERIEDRLTAHADDVDYATTLIPRVIFAEIEVEVSCREIRDFRWIAQTSKNWVPSEEDKKRRRVLDGVQDRRRSAWPVLAFVGRDRHDAHYGTTERSRAMPNSGTIDFERWAIVAIGEGEPRFQLVNPDAVETERVWEVDVPITTSACRPNIPKLPKLVWLADDNDPEYGSFLVDGAPLFIRQTAEPSEVTNFEPCSTLFPRWDLYAVSKPDIQGWSLLLYLYGKPRRRKPKEVDHTYGVGVEGMLNIILERRGSPDCPESVNDQPPPAEAFEEAYEERRARMRTPYEFVVQDAPVRLIPDVRYDDPAWDITKDDCYESWVEGELIE